MFRRGVLGGAASLAAGLSGCSGITGGGGGDSSITFEDVLSTTAAFYGAATDGDVETVNSLVHPDAPVDAFPASVIERFQRANASIRGVDQHSSIFGSEYTEYRPKVDVVLFSDAADPFRFAFTVGVRSFDDEPHVYARATREPFPMPPDVEWTITPRTIDADERWIDFEHVGGDPIPYERLHARVGERRPRAFYGPTVTVDRGVVVRIYLDRPAHRHAAGETAELLWQPEPLGGPPSEQPCYRIGEYTLEEASPGFWRIGIVE